MSEEKAADARLGEALRELWAAIRVQHPDLPEASPVVAGPKARTGGFLLGSLTARHRENPLREGAEATLVALLHEAAHLTAERLGEQDTSNRGHFHNQIFRRHAESLGLAVAEDDPTKRGGGRRGWARLTLPPATAQRYATPVRDLEAALQTYPAPAQDTPPPRGYVKIWCQCRTLRAAPSEAARGGVFCTHCEHYLTADGPVSAD
ncbi:hypothetical protein DI005_20135 [Prauserella sp. PE36]|uniref:hypothetical protein n=1 Tax=Prauserella sp. PE36 TaxID=1504709 RepID=UPI000DE41259|nr:hypothetical protein [Prauserella sp. PE36]RBM18104.1 hypothetical protein DI005_20135 [Prauserella sp. PE36]